MPVSYNSKFIIPGPFAEIKKLYSFLEDGRKIGKGFEIVLTGRLKVNMGSPNSSGSFHTTSGYPTDETIDTDAYLTTMLKKYEALRSLFSENGKELKIQGYDGGAELTCNPIVVDITEPKGNVTSWAQLADYQIRLKVQDIFINGTALSHDSDISNTYIEKFDETWNIEGLDEFQRTFRLTHQVFAKGNTYYDTSGNLRLAWQNAQNYVLNGGFLGLDATRLYASGVINGGLLYDSGGNVSTSGLQAFNYLRANNISESAGTFGVTETWVCYDPGSGAYATEEFQVEVRESLENGLTDVSIQGTIQGLEYRNNSTYFTVNSDRWTNAQAKFNEVQDYLHARAQNLSEVTLNPTPLQKIIAKNSIKGSINYTYGFNNRPSTNVSGALSEIITVAYENPADVFAEIAIVGQASGPIIQGMSTYTSRKKNLSIEVVMTPKVYGGSSPSMPSTNSLVTTYVPSATTRKLARDTETWSENTGRYSRNVSWTYNV